MQKIRHHFAFKTRKMRHVLIILGRVGRRCQSRMSYFGYVAEDRTKWDILYGSVFFLIDLRINFLKGGFDILKLDNVCYCKIQNRISEKTGKKILLL